MSVRGLSIFQVFKDIKETMSGASGNNPSASDGPSSIFYVSASASTEKIEQSGEAEGWNTPAEQRESGSKSPSLSFLLLGNESPPPGLDSKKFKQLDTKSVEQIEQPVPEPDNDKRATSESVVRFGPFHVVRPISTTSSISDIPSDKLQISPHHPHQSLLQLPNTDSQQAEKGSRNKKKRFIFGTGTHWKFKNRRKGSGQAFAEEGDSRDSVCLEDLGPLSLQGFETETVTRRDKGGRRPGSERSSNGSNWGGFGSLSSRSPRSSVSVSSDGKASRASSGSDSFSDALSRSFLHKLWVKKNPSSEDISIIPSSSALVSQQLQHFDNPGQKQFPGSSDRECQSRGSQTDIHISSQHQQDFDNEDLASQSPTSPSRSLLGRVKDFHRNRVFSFGSSSGNSPASGGNKARSKSSSRSNSRNANHAPGHNSSGSSSSDFYRRPSAPNGFGQESRTDSRQSYLGESEEKNEWRKTDRNVVKKGRRLGSVSHHHEEDHDLRGEDEEEEERQSGSLEESRRNSSEEELTSINNVPVSGAGKMGKSLGTTTSVTMTLPRHGSRQAPNPLSSSSLSDCEVASDQSKENEYQGPFVGKAVALVDCIPSPYDRHALRYKKGDVIEIISKKPTGTWTGKVLGKVGHFKFINVQVLPEEEEDEEDVFPSGPDDYEGDYSRDEDYYYNNCARFADASDASLPRRRRRKHSLTPLEMEQRQSVASVINGLRKENALLRKTSEMRSLEVQGNYYDDPSNNPAPNSMPPTWSQSLWDHPVPPNLKGFPQVRRSLSREGKMRKEKKGRPKSVRDLLERINLGNYISLFILHGFESLDLFKELEEEDLDRLAIVEGADRGKILTAAELLREYDTEEEIPITPAPSPPSAAEPLPPPPPAFSTHPRDSGIFVKFEEEGENPVIVESDNSAALHARAGQCAPESTNRDSQELILSPANLQKLGDEKGYFGYLNEGAGIKGAERGAQGSGAAALKGEEGEDKTDFYGDVKQRFLNARSMFEMASNQGAVLSGNSKSQENLVTSKNRFFFEKSSDSGISCSTNSPTLVPSD